MKLYTEEQVRQIAKQVIEYGYYDNLNVTPIQLPSDEEIEKQIKHIAHNYFDMHNTNHYQGLKEGAERMAKWMRDKIQGGNK